MDRKETVVEVSTSDDIWGGTRSRTDEYEGVFLGFGKVQRPLGTKDARYINQFMLVRHGGPTKHAQKPEWPARER
jgi:hypothetical protein